MNKYFFSQPTFTSSTWAMLSITRFFLAFVVMLSIGHLSNFTNPGIFFNTLSRFGGKTAVMVFLMISGIAVGYSITRSKEGFYKRRFLRIYPLYFIAVLLTVFLQYYLGSPYVVKDTSFVAAGNLTSISNFLLLQGIASLTIMYNFPLWSISVEVFLYFILPFLCLLPLRYIYLTALFSVLLYVAHTHLFSINLFGVQHIIYAWSFVVGFLIAVKKQLWGTLPIILIGTFGIYYNFLTGVVLEKFSFLFFLVTVVIIICFMYVKIKLSNFIKNSFNYLGDISYPMYLFHIPFYFILYHIGISSAYVLVGLSILLCFPMNYIFDIWLKKIFWKPLVKNMESLTNRFLVNRTEIKTEKL